VDVAEVAWLTPGVRGIGLASFLADVGREIPTALLPSLLTSTLANGSPSSPATPPTTPRAASSSSSP